MQVDGIPDGYELVRIGRAKEGDVFFSATGEVAVWIGRPSASTNHVIVRKVEKPKTFRPFKDGAEYAPHFDRPVTRTRYTMRPSCFWDAGVKVDENYTWHSAYELLKFADGTPFGVEVSE